MSTIWDKNEYVQKLICLLNFFIKVDRIIIVAIISSATNTNNKNQSIQNECNSTVFNSSLKTLNASSSKLFCDLVIFSSNSLVKKRVYGPRKDFFYLHTDAQHSLKFPAGVVPTLVFLLIYIIMTSFPQKLADFFSFVDFYFIHSHYSYGWT